MQGICAPFDIPFYHKVKIAKLVEGIRICKGLESYSKNTHIIYLFKIVFPVKKALF